MSLETILLDLATTGGLQIDDLNQRLYETMRVNKAAKEIYDSTELINSLRAQYVQVMNTEGFTISLPHYVGTIKAVRMAEPNIGLTMLDMRPRFQSKLWKGKNWDGWRLLGEYATCRELAEASVLTVTFRQMPEKSINVTITGMTQDATEDSETLEFVLDSGDQFLTTTKSFLSITSITKNDTCAYDADVQDLQGNTLAVLPNNQLKSLYLWVQIFNPATLQSSFQMSGNQTYFEILWKYRFRPMINLQDEFMCPDYDSAIVWKRREHIAAESTDPAETAKAVGYAMKSAQLVKQKTESFTSSTEKIMNITPDLMQTAFSDLEYGNMWSSDSRYPYGSSQYYYNF